MTGILRPSSAPIWSRCAGSFMLEALYPEDEEGPKAREGTAAHFYVTEAVQGRVHPVGTLAPNGHPIDAETVEAGQCFVDDYMAALKALPGMTPVASGVEVKLTMHGLIHPDCEGTPDAYLLDMAGKQLIVWDYKYGHGYVEPFGNAQMLCYVAGIFEAYELTEADVCDLAVSIRIVQPRNYDAVGPVRRWDTTGAVCWAEIEVLSRMAHAAKAPEPVAQTGDHCRYCTANLHCRVSQQAVGLLVDMAGRAVPQELPPEALGLYLRILEDAVARLTHHRDAGREVTLATVKRGERVPGWAIGSTKARERWAKPPAEVFAMGDMMGADLRKPAEPITPAQARDKGLDAAVIAAYAERPPGAPKLVPHDDTTAARVFGGTTRKEADNG